MTNKEADPVLALVAQWRKKTTKDYISAQISFGGAECDEARAQAPAYRECADDLSAALAARPPHDVMELLLDAQAFVQASPLWPRFIDGTPLKNDIAVWMVEFALKAMKEAQ